jgi:hypothetical protein
MGAASIYVQASFNRIVNSHSRNENHIDLIRYSAVYCSAISRCAIMSAIPVHQTRAQKIHDPSKEGWEFSCPHCSYRARSTSKNGRGPRTLEIIDGGDPGARHTGASTGAAWKVEWGRGGPDFGEIAASHEGEGGWLPPHLRLQIEELLNRVDKHD